MVSVAFVILIVSASRSLTHGRLRPEQQLAARKSSDCQQPSPAKAIFTEIPVDCRLGGTEMKLAIFKRIIEVHGAKSRTSPARLDRYDRIARDR
jgi:hypothetical protein